MGTDTIYRVKALAFGQLDGSTGNAMNLLRGKIYNLNEFQYQKVKHIVQLLDKQETINEDEMKQGDSIRILLVTHNNWFKTPRGGQISMQRIMQYLKEFGYNCKIIMPSNNKNGEFQDIPIEFLEIYGEALDKQWFRHYDKIKEIISDFKPDVLLCLASSVSITGVIAKKLNIPYIVFIRSMEILYTDAINNIKHADIVITNCIYTSKLLKSKHKINSICSYVPVYLTSNNHLLFNKKNKEYIGIIGASKCRDFVNNIATKMKRKNFLIIDYLMTSEYKKDNITYLPYQYNMDEFWNEIKLLLFPSDIDLSGTSHVTMEAMRRGIPVIAQNRCGIIELNPIYVKKNASLKEWKHKINEIENNLDKYIKYVEKYSYENYDYKVELEKIRKEINKLIKSKGHVLYYMKEGIGNLVEMIPSLKAIISLGFKLDVVVDSTSPEGFDLIDNLSFINNVFKNPPVDLQKYDHLFSCHWKNEFLKNKRVVCSDIYIDKAEKKWYLSLPKKLGYAGIDPSVTLFYPKKYIDIPKNTVAFSIGCISELWRFKQWEYFDKLASYFKSVVLLGSNKDIVPKYKFGKNVLNFIGELSLLESISVLDQCALFIGNDGGLAHISAGLNICTFVIFGGTSKIKNLPDKAHVIEKNPKEECQPCQFTNKFLNCEYNICLKKLDSEEVIINIKSVLSEEYFKFLTKPKKSTMVHNIKKIRLNVGQTGKMQGEWVSVDINKEGNPDIVDDIRILSKIEDRSCLEIFASHVLEHIHEIQVLDTLKVFYKKLDPAGKLIIYVPDVEEGWRLYFNKQLSNEIVLQTMIGQEPTRNPYQLHLTMFWYSRLLDLLKSAGFITFKRLPCRPGRLECGIEAYK